MFFKISFDMYMKASIVKIIIRYIKLPHSLVTKEMISKNEPMALAFGADYLLFSGYIRIFSYLMMIKRIVRIIDFIYENLSTDSTRCYENSENCEECSRSIWRLSCSYNSKTNSQCSFRLFKYNVQ